MNVSSFSGITIGNNYVEYLYVSTTNELVQLTKKNI
jgi:hypothetical protein